MEELVSVIIPIHNSENYLTKCLNSVLEQRYSNYEMILVLDNCTDNSENIIDRYLINNKNMKKVISNYKSAGLSRNIGLKNANGKYVCFLDSDDYIDSNYILKLVENIEKENADVVYCGYNKFMNDYVENYSCFQYKIFEKEGIKKELLKNCFRFNKDNNFGTTSVWAAIYRMNKIRQNKISFLNENIVLSEDTLFNLEYLMNSQRVVFLDENLYYYNKGNNSSITQILSVDRLKNIDNWYNICNSIVENSEYCIENLDISYLLYFIDYLKQQAIVNRSFKKFREGIDNNVNSKILLKILKNNTYIKRNIKRKNFLMIRLLQRKHYLIIFTIYKIYYLIKGK